MIQIKNRFFHLDSNGDMEVFQRIEGSGLNHIHTVGKDTVKDVCIVIAETDIPINILAAKNEDVLAICGMFMCYPTENLGMAVH